MNAFVRHHRDAIRFDYSCFDRMILAGYIPGLQMPGQVASFLRDRRQVANFSRAYFASLAQNYRVQVEKLAADLGVDILEPERNERREDLVKSSLQNLHPPGIAAIIKAREPERVAINQRGQSIDMARRWVICYTFYLQDPHCGPMSVRICPYFPFNISVWMNQHYWLVRQMQQQGIAFRQCDNCFLDCVDPQRLQQLADSFAAEHIQASVDCWVGRLLPFFSARERTSGYRHHLVMRQIEYCHNLIFHDKAAVTKLFDRLLDQARALGHPNKLAIIFGRSRFHVDARTGEVEEKVTRLRTPVIRASWGKNSIKQYVREGGALRTEAATCQLKELSLPKGIEHLPHARRVLGQCTERFESVQQDVLETFVDRGQLQELLQPTVSSSGRRIPGLRPHDPRLLAVLQAVLCFMHLAGKACFKTAALLIDVQKALDNPNYKLSQLRYDLGKLRGKGLVLRLPGTQSYQLTAIAFKVGLLFLKLHQRFYAPLTAAILDPQAADNLMLHNQTCQLDRLYLAVVRTLDKLSEHFGLPA